MELIEIVMLIGFWKELVIVIIIDYWKAVIATTLVNMHIYCSFLLLLLLCHNVLIALLPGLCALWRGGEPSWIVNLL